MSVLLMLGQRYWRQAIGVALLVIAGIAFAFCRPSSPSAIPRPLADAVERHTIATAIDTTVIHQLRIAAAAARDAQRRDSIKAAHLEQDAQLQHVRADSLATAAARAGTAADSASMYHAALDERTAEVHTLQAANAEKDLQIEYAIARGDSIDKALTRSEARSFRADSVIKAAVKEVGTRTPPCHIAHFFACPSRIASAAIGGAVVGGVVTVIAIAARGSR